MHATPMEALEGEAEALLYSPFSAQLAPSSSSSSQCQQHLLQQQDQPTTSFPCPGLVSGIDLASLLLPSTMGLLQPMPASEGEGAGGAGGGKDKGRNSGKSTKKVSRPRFAFKTRTPSDILDDGYRWRKYGQKAVKNSAYPRSYYRCTHHTCNVKKQVQRLSKDTSIVVTTYEGIHNHPCEKLMEALSPLLKQMQFLNGF